MLCSFSYTSTYVNMYTVKVSFQQNTAKNALCHPADARRTLYTRSAEAILYSRT